jgi:hypothetical protein
MHGSIELFSVCYDGMRPRGQEENKPYSLTCKLPGIKDRLGHFANIDEAKVYAEKVFTLWLVTIGLEIKQ